MRRVKGDIIQLALEGKFDVIVHGCNCFCTMGAGLAKSIKEVFPEVYAADCKTPTGDKKKLGRISAVKIMRSEMEMTVINAYTQYHWSSDTIQVDYQAMRSVFHLIKKNFSGKRIAYPKIGAGLAGGDWDIIAKIIDEALVGEDHCLVVYETP